MRYSVIAAAFVILVSCSDDNPRRQQTFAPEKSELELLIEKTAVNPNDADAWYHLADLYERGELYENEIEALKRVVTIQPTRGYAYLKMGTAYNRLGRYEDAVHAFSKAQRHQSRNPVLYNNMAYAYGKLGKNEKEIAALRKAIALRPRYATARFNLGMASLRTGNRGEVVKQYEALKEIDASLADMLKRELDKRR